MKDKKQNVSPEEFVTIWETCDSLEQVAKELTKRTGKPYTKAMASSRAAEYRHNQVHLKTMDSGRARIKPNLLNQLIEKLREPEPQLQN